MFSTLLKPLISANRRRLQLELVTVCEILGWESHIACKPEIQPQKTATNYSEIQVWADYNFSKLAVFIACS